MVFHSVPRAVQLLFPRRIWQGDSSDNKIYLTFDDGPVPGVTDFVLNELAKRNQKATFFMVGDNIRKFSDLAREVLQEGHGIGNHTYNHCNGWKTRNPDYIGNVLSFDRTAGEILGTQTSLFRPPYGLLKSSQAKAILKTKKIVMWNVLTGDYDQSLDSSRILEKSIQNSRPGRIVVFHDQQKTRQVLPKVLPGYLDFLIERGIETAIL